MAAKRKVKRSTTTSFSVTDKGVLLSARAQRYGSVSSVYLGKSLTMKALKATHAVSRDTQAVARVNVREFNKGRKKGTAQFGTFTIARSGGVLNANAAVRGTALRHTLNQGASNYLGLRQSALGSGAYRGKNVRTGAQLKGVFTAAPHKQSLQRPANRGLNKGNHAQAVRVRHKRTFFARDSKGHFR